MISDSHEPDSAPLEIPATMSVILATDCGSTTTKAILIERIDGVYRQTYRGEAPTTVEAPYEDVTRGVLNAIAEIEALSGRRILDGECIIRPSGGQPGGGQSGAEGPSARAGIGVDLYISTSSAGGGLQMMVAGAVQSMTGESAQRCALGAGAIVMDVLATNDGRLPHEKIERLRTLRPDMVLLSGGTDGGSVNHVLEMAEYIAAAKPRPRLGSGYRLPLIYAGNMQARERVGKVLHEVTALEVTENIRPSLERENLGPAREKIHDLFLEHVMAQAPGYKTLMGWVGAPVLPTPAAVGRIMEMIARKQGLNIIGVDIGGATTDVFSVYQGTFVRTVSANVGMSYSISNVLAEAGLERILRWLPFPIEEQDLRNRIKNKMIRPTTIPQIREELLIEQAVAREALRLAMDHHHSLATGLKGVQQERTISDIFDQRSSGGSRIDMGDVGLLIGSGGILSHAPRRCQAMLMMVDAFEPVGVTAVCVDSIFMMPHLGVLSTVAEEAAFDVVFRDCLIKLGTCVAPTGQGKPGEPCLTYELTFKDERPPQQGTVTVGEIQLVPLGPGERAEIRITPAKRMDVGMGRGVPLTREIEGGTVGVLLDGRGRPLQVPSNPSVRMAALQRWYRAVDLYPEEQFQGIVGGEDPSLRSGLPSSEAKG